MRTGISICSTAPATAASPGTLALRAANNVNIDATISDGFFASYAALNGAPTQYSQEVNSALYRNYLALLSNGLPQYSSSGINAYLSLVGKSWSSLGLTAPAMTSSASAAFFNVSQSVFSTLQFQLQAPMVITGSDSVIDQYNQYYAEYLTMFRAYETEIIAMNTNATIGRAGSVGTVTGAGLLSYSDFINYVAKIRGVATTSTNLINPVTSNYVSLAPPAAPTTSSPYYNIANGLSSIKFNGSRGYTDTLFAHTQNYSWGADGYGYSLIAPNLSVTALTGSIQLANGSPYDSVLLYPSATGELSLVAGGSILGSATRGSVTFGVNLTLADYASSPCAWAPMLGSQPAALTSPLHAGDDAPVVIYAGGDINRRHLHADQGGAPVGGTRHRRRHLHRPE